MCMHALYTHHSFLRLYQLSLAQVTIVDPSNIPTVLISALPGKTTFSSTEVQSLCGQSSICTIGRNTVFQMNDSINVAALVIQGSFQWTDITATSDYHLCAGYVFVQTNGSFNLNVSQHNAYIYLKVRHEMLSLCVCNIIFFKCLLL